MAKRHISNPHDLRSLIVRLEELVLANSGEDEFEEIFKLLIAKLWDERSGKQRRFCSQHTDVATTKALSELLAEAEAAWPGIVGQGNQFRLTAEHLGVCVSTLAAQDLSDAGLEVLDNLFEFLVAKQAKGAKGQYFTPRNVIDFCVKALRPRAEESILDPACGSGGFLFQALDHVCRAESFSPQQKSA
jgi:type I restriction enzyme M protein